MLPHIIILAGIILLILFLSTGGIDDIPENISILIIGALMGGALVFMFK